MGSAGGFRQQYSAGPRGARQYSQPQEQPAASLNVEQPIVLSLEEVANGAQKTIYLVHSGKGVTVNIPKGIKPGGKIRLSGEGQAGPGGRRGDVHLVVEYQKHNLFDVDGYNLIYEAPVNIPDLALGTEITVPTLKGNVALKIPAGTQPGKTLRLKGQGVPHKDGVGDLLVKIKARFPDKLSEEELALYRQLKELQK
jgi:curved DNA-binding protein